ncbi:MAG: hypothetical protein AAF401_01170 [Pseudomonadota bacterium]
MSIWARIKSAVQNYWLIRIFAAEFGFSDVQANYSRSYSWMANQLGHMTLGLAVALAFVWIAETVSSASALYMSWIGGPVPMDRVCDTEQFCWLNNALLIAVTALMLLTPVALGVMTVLPPKKDEQDTENEARQRARRSDARYHALPAQARQALAAAFLLAYLAMLWRAIGELGAVDAANAAKVIDDAGFLVSIAVMTGAVVRLCRDWMMLLAAAITLCGSAVLAISDSGEDLLIGLAAAYIVMSCIATMVRKRGDEIQRQPGQPPLRPREARWQFVWNAVWPLWFIGVVAYGVHPDWRLPLAAGVASLTVWWVKEFGSDLPNVCDEMTDVELKRPENILYPRGASTAEDLEDFQKLEFEYRDDARMDARTDGAFYFAGAWIAAGVLSAEPSLTNNVWYSGAELVGFLFFLIVFLVFGETWIKRQAALDKIGVARASRLAVFRAALRIFDTSSPAAPNALRPLLYLADFAKRVGHQPDEVRHVVVFGADGAGLSPLGRALASEAALATLSTTSANDKGAFKTGRFVSAEDLCSQEREVKRRRSALAVNPTFDMITASSDPESKAWRRAKDVEPSGEQQEVDAASLVVIAKVNPANTAQLADIASKLQLDTGQQTVWMVEIVDTDDAKPLTEDDPAKWPHDPAVYSDAVAAIDNALREVGDEGPLTYAVARRFEPS